MTRLSLTVKARAAAALAAMTLVGGGLTVALTASADTTAAVMTCKSVSQHGVTYTFDRAYPCGKFVNGDWWVAGASVGVRSVSPGASGGRHGLMANPSSKAKHAYDSRIGGYDAALNLDLPARVTGGTSLVKAVSSSRSCGNGKGHPACLRTATVLTVLGAAPPGGGAKIFRPPYFGTDKPLISTTSIRTDLLPKLAPVAGAPSLDAVRDRYSRVQLDHKSSWQGRYMHPIENFMNLRRTEVSNYGSDLARDNNDAALRLMLNDPISAKMPALVNYLQAGIDWYGAAKGGVTYHPDGGHNVGRKVAVTFAGVVLNHSGIKAVAGSTDSKAFSENGHVYRGAGGRPLFGKGCRDGEYLEVLNDGRGARDCRDPRGKIDGGEKPGALYQRCCTAKAFIGSSLAARLLPGGRSVWNADHFHEYVDRWTSFGTWAPTGGFASLHGGNAGEGHYGSTFQTEMWDAYKSHKPAAAPRNEPAPRDLATSPARPGAPAPDAGRPATATWPAKSDVGPRGTLQPSRTLTVTKPGTVIENKLIRGYVRIEADNVTLRNVRIVWNGERHPLRVVKGATGAVFDRIEIDGNVTPRSRVSFPDAAAIEGGGYTLTNFYIHDVPEGPRPRSNVTMKVGIIHRLVRIGSNHADAMQIVGATDVHVEQVSIRALNQSGKSEGINAGLQAGTEVEEVRNVVFVRNYFDGGAVPVNLGGGGSRDARIRFQDNLFGRNARWDLIKYATEAQTFANNVFADNGEPIRLS